MNIILRAATRYLDKVILSYNLARGDVEPWRGAREGMVYYAQNAVPILKTAVWIVILERVLTVVLWLLLLTPAAAITWMLPRAVRESAGIVTILVAAILAGPLRAAFLKPLFLIMMMVRFHALIENQPINQEWDARLATISDKFRDLGTQAMAGFASGGMWPSSHVNGARVMRLTRARPDRILRPQTAANTNRQNAGGDCPSSGHDHGVRHRRDGVAVARPDDRQRGAAVYAGQFLGQL